MADPLDEYMNSIEQQLVIEQKQIEEKEAINQAAAALKASTHDSPSSSSSKKHEGVSSENQGGFVGEKQAEEVFWDDEEHVGTYGEFFAQRLKSGIASGVLSEKHFDVFLSQDDEGFNSDDEVYSTAKTISSLSDFSKQSQGNDKNFLMPKLSVGEKFVKLFDRNHYNEHSDVSSMMLQEVVDLRKKFEIEVTGKEVTRLIGSFTHLKHSINKTLRETLAKLGFHMPTPIQCQAVPVALSGRNLLGIAATGSGKSLAYLLPLITHTEYLIEQGWREGSKDPVGLILCPTRELAIQIDKDLKNLTKRMDIRSTLLAGGMNKTEQFRDLKAGVEIVTANPGRLIDIAHMKGISLELITFLVLDEVDRMLAMGFEKQMQSILQAIRPDRQILMFSATLPADIERIAGSLMRNPVKIFVGNSGNVPEQIHQNFSIFDFEEQKWQWCVANISRILNFGQILVFCNSQSRAVDIAHLLEQLISKYKKAEKQGETTNFSLEDGDFIDEEAKIQSSFNAISKVTEPQTHSYAMYLHGSLDQTKRLQTLSHFSKKKIPVMVATDVAARGLDIPSVNLVINYDASRDLDTHIHRIGRTGRAGRSGTAHTFLVSKHDLKMAALIATHMETMNQEVPKNISDLALLFPPYKSSKLSGVRMAIKSKKPQNQGAGASNFTGLGFRTHYDEDSSPPLPVSLIPLASGGQLLHTYSETPSESVYTPAFDAQLSPEAAATSSSASHHSVTEQQTAKLPGHAVQDFKLIQDQAGDLFHKANASTAKLSEPPSSKELVSHPTSLEERKKPKMMQYDNRWDVRTAYNTSKSNLSRMTVATTKSNMDLQAISKNCKVVGVDDDLSSSDEETHTKPSSTGYSSFDRTKPSDSTPGSRFSNSPFMDSPLSPSSRASSSMHTYEHQLASSYSNDGRQQDSQKSLINVEKRRKQKETFLYSRPGAAALRRFGQRPYPPASSVGGLSAYTYSHSAVSSDDAFQGGRETAAVSPSHNTHHLHSANPSASSQPNESGFFPSSSFVGRLDTPLKASMNEGFSKHSTDFGKIERGTHAAGGRFSTISNGYRGFQPSSSSSSDFRGENVGVSAVGGYVCSSQDDGRMYHLQEKHTEDEKGRKGETSSVLGGYNVGFDGGMGVQQESRVGSGGGSQKKKSRWDVQAA